MTRGWQDEVIDDLEYKHQRADLLDEQQAARAAVERARDQNARLAEVRALDAEEEVLRRYGDLRRAVLDGIGKATNLDALRAVLRTMFEAIIYWPAERWGDALVVPGTSDGSTIGNHGWAGEAVLVPVLKRSAVAEYDGDPLETQPKVQRAVLDLEQPLREGHPS